jgi:hypothetical protein
MASRYPPRLVRPATPEQLPDVIVTEPMVAPTL